MSYFKEKDKNSSTRLIFIVGSFWAMALTTYYVMATDNNPASILAFYTGVQATLVALKLGQKQQETKNSMHEKNN